jgi:hypothetical protein
VNLFFIEPLFINRFLSFYKLPVSSFCYLITKPGPGEQGAAVILSAEEEKKKDDLYKVNGFNAYASDKISLDRSLKDIRHPE